jgi:hypothetical protein
MSLPECIHSKLHFEFRSDTKVLRVLVAMIFLVLVCTGPSTAAFPGSVSQRRFLFPTHQYTISSYSASMIPKGESADP